MAVDVETEYPFAGTVNVRIGRCATGPDTLTLRIPGLGERLPVLVNGQETGSGALSPGPRTPSTRSSLDRTAQRQGNIDSLPTLNI